jgi:hypothetical protein
MGRNISPLITTVLIILNLKLKSACVATYLESTGFTQYLNESYFEVFSCFTCSISAKIAQHGHSTRFDSIQ